MFVPKILSKYDLVLKDLLQETPWCNWSLIWMLGLTTIAFLSIKSLGINADVSSM